MSDFSSRPTGTAQDDTGTQSSDEGSSSTSNGYETAARARPSFWARVARLVRPAQGEKLRENIADALLTDSDIGAAFSPEERAMLQNILHFREVRVEDVMVPRADIEAVEQSITIRDLLVLFEDSGRSRMPVYRETLDDPRGMVHIRDVLSYVTRQARNKRRGSSKTATAESGEKPARQPRPVFDLARVDLDKSVAEAGLIREVLFVPPSMLASDLLKRMQAARTQMAVVIDEYGGTDGLVSHEDIVEMVVGDIEDEHDDEDTMIVRVSDDTFVADARAELEEIAEAFGPDFDVREQVEDIDTLGGLIFSALGRIPARGEVVEAIPGFEFHILDADPRRIKRVRIVRKKTAAVRRQHHRGPIKDDGTSRSGTPAPVDAEPGSSTDES
ncbi:hemolysin family protein [Allorhizobium borbori]|uniref:CBS domain containing-hemolysin-like protein n=1 Tax=Allorhizobium borbori TaxID=485907 RepID=A0A7W6JXX1_9HYPH|nr:hemolysin family protein [Allorhizobium borbori]MBB4101598.1 CBS domain containing-hemolysin-like protein [Allorhizobium borbori]PZU21847.1 MAG: magnesium/cobalt efflux protein [Shinella sp.]